MFPEMTTHNTDAHKMCPVEKIFQGPKKKVIFI